MKERPEYTALPESMQQAISELRRLIAQRFPAALFRVRCGVDDPQQTYLVTTVDIEDPDEVLETVLDRLLELQLDQGLPINVIPVHTPERIAETRRRIAAHQGKRSRKSSLPSLLPG